MSSTVGEQYSWRAAHETTLTNRLLLVAAGLLLLYIVWRWRLEYFLQRGVPTLKLKWTDLVDTIAIFLGLKAIPEIVKKSYERGKGHDIVGNFEFGKVVYMIRSPEILKVVGVKQFNHFTNHRAVVSENSDPLFMKNVFNLKDERWRNMRATLSPAFTTSKIRGMFHLISACAEQMSQHLKAKYDESAGEKGLETDIKDMYTRMANDVIASVAFGLQCNSLKEPNNAFYNMGKRLTTFKFLRALIFMIYFMLPKIMAIFKIRVLEPKAMSFFDSLVQETVRERKKHGIFRPDMLQLLMQAQEGNLRAEKEDQHEEELIGDTNQEITDEDVSAQAIIFFFAGFETVSTALCFSTYEISHHPEVQRRLQQEVDEVWEKSGGKPSYEDVQGMKYLDAVINESLRMHPPIVILDRECGEDITLPATKTAPPILIRKGESVNFPAMGIHHDPEYWPEPERFDPERFSEENKHNIKPFTHIPFGIGPRLCIAQRFALVEVKLGILYLLRHFHLQPSPKTAHPMRYENGFNMNIKGGFWSYLTPRNV